MFAVSFSNKADGSLQIGAGETFLVKELTDRLLVMALLPVPITDAQALAIAVLKDDKAEIAKLMDELHANGFEADGDVLVTDEWLDTVLKRKSDLSRWWSLEGTEKYVIRWSNHHKCYCVDTHDDDRVPNLTRRHVRYLIWLEGMPPNRKTDPKATATPRLTFDGR